MPRVSKIKSGASHSSTTAYKEDERKEYYCCKCGKSYKNQRGNFPASQSLIFHGNNGYLPICVRCLDELYEHYKEVLKNEADAMRRICLKFDIYWNTEIFAMTERMNPNMSRVRSYISKSNLVKFCGKTFDNTLDEDDIIVTAKDLMDDASGSGSGKIVSGDDELQDTNSGFTVSKDVVEFWGTGFEPLFYAELDRKYKQWTEDRPKPLPKAEEALYKQICILEATINRDVALGKAIESKTNTLNNLLGSLNEKPSQKKEDDASTAAFDSLPFGVGIKMYEGKKPIKDPDPEFKDKNHIIKYVTTWVLGHLCKMLRIKNTYSKLYEEAIEQYRVERPDLAEEDDETLFDDIFGNGGDGS